MFSILDGREHFYQWDLDRKLIVKDGTIDKVHFCNITGSSSLIRNVYNVNGTYLVDVPNILLQESYRLNVYGYDRNYTKYSQTFNIVARTRPEDYIYTEEEKAQWEELEERINQIEQNGISDEAVANAIENYLTENPIETGATKEQAEQIAANTEAIEGLAIELDNYYTKAETDALLAELPTGGEGGSTADLSNYYTKAQTDAAIEAAQPDLSNYATTTYVDETISAAQPDLTGYALKSDIPNVSAYQTAEQVETAINTALAGIGIAEEGAY